MSTEQMRAAVNRFQGLENAVRLEVGGDRIPGRFEGGYTPARRALGEASQPARLVVDHPDYKATADLLPPVRERLMRDLS
jgi:hypothetical protein